VSSKLARSPIGDGFGGGDAVPAECCHHRRSIVHFDAVSVPHPTIVTARASKKAIAFEVFEKVVVSEREASTSGESGVEVAKARESERSVHVAEAKVAALAVERLIVIVAKRAN